MVNISFNFVSERGLEGNATDVQCKGRTVIALYCSTVNYYKYRAISQEMDGDRT